MNAANPLQPRQLNPLPLGSNSSRDNLQADVEAVLKEAQQRNLVAPGKVAILGHSMGSGVAMTRTPDAHFATEARHAGAKLVVLSPDFSMTSKYADQWIPIHAGQDAAFWLAVDHVILKEFHHQRQTPYFLDYVRRYSDAPFLVELETRDGALRPGRMLRASQLARTRDVENGDFKFLVWDGTASAPRMPRGSLGFRWQHEKGQWNLELKDGVDGLEIDARTTLLDATPTKMSIIDKTNVSNTNCSV